jgi:hypothetical protein
MRAYFNPFLPALGFCGRLPASNFRRGVPWQQQPGQGEETAADAKVGELDAYKVAVVLLVGAAIFSLF